MKIKGITFAPFCGKGVFSEEETYRSFDLMLEKTGMNYVMLVPNGVQDTPQSEQIDRTSMCTCDDDELIQMIEYAHKKGVSVALKPTVNCKNGTWRAHINFFDIDVPCEPKWKNWFASYTEFQLHYAEIAQRTGCEMFLPGCEMVMSERRETEWRMLIARIREVYDGVISYNTDKYQEDRVAWWDCVDVISSSGYYPINDWEKELDRIGAVVKKFQKPFFFAEVGCMSVEGSSKVPNDWSIQAQIRPEEQAEWYQKMFAAIEKRDWVDGVVIWAWTDRLYPEDRAMNMGGYDIYGKPAMDVVRREFAK